MNFKKAFLWINYLILIFVFQPNGLTEEVAASFHTYDQWSRPQIWNDEDRDGFLDTVITFSEDQKPLTEVQWGGEAMDQIRIQFYDQDGSFTQYSDTTGDGFMDKKTVSSPGTPEKIEEIKLAVIYDPDFGIYEIYSEFTEDHANHVEYFDEERRLRRRMVYHKSGIESQEAWDETGALIDPMEDSAEETWQDDWFFETPPSIAEILSLSHDFIHPSDFDDAEDVETESFEASESGIEE